MVTFKAYAKKWQGKIKKEMSINFILTVESLECQCAFGR